MSADLHDARLAAVIDAAREGSLPAARQLVERFQRDVLATAYLLTGKPEGARYLAGRTFARYFETLGDGDSDDDPLPQLLRLLARVWLYPDADVTASDPLRTTAGAPERYRVEDERSRMRAALELLDPAERLALVVSDLAGLPPAELAGLAPVQVDLPALRWRVTRAANLDGPGAIPAALRALAVETPRATLWDEIGPEVEALFALRRQRARWLALGAAGVVVLVLLAIAGLLIRGALGDDDSSSGAAAVPTATSLQAPTSVSTPFPRYTPPGQVSDMLLYAAEPGVEATAATLHDLATGVSYPLPGTEPVLITPDGGMLLLLERGPGSRWSLIAASAVDGAERWRVELGEGAEGGVVYDLAVVGERVYVALSDPGRRELSISVILLADGSQRDTWRVDIGAPAGPDVEVDLIGTLPPLTPSLFVLARGGDAPWTTLLQLELPSGTPRIESRLNPGELLPAGRAMLAPGGRAILSIPANGPSADPSIAYLLPDTLASGRIELPFLLSPAVEQEVVEYVHSHDGRRLYAIAPYAGRVAVVDLTTRLVERVIDLDGADSVRSIPAALEPGVVAEMYAGLAAAFSLDGRHLHALGPLVQAPSGGYVPAVWTIDTASWMVVEERLPDDLGRVASLLVGADGAVCLQIVAADGAASVVSLAGAAPLDLPDPSGQRLLGTLADQYRAVYGRSPSVGAETPRDNYETETIPAVDVEISPPSARSGWEFDVRVILRDPATWRPLDGPEPGLRGADPPAITTIFRNGDERRVAVLGAAGGGAYSGRIVLDRPGDWDLTLLAGEPGGDGWSVARAGAVEVVDIVTDSAGREYVLTVTTRPAPLVAGEQGELTVTFEHINSGLILPNSEIPSSEELERALPATLALTLPGGQAITLQRAGSIHYTAQVRFPTPGVHFPTARYTNDRGQEVTVTLRVEVAPG